MRTSVIAALACLALAVVGCTGGVTVSQEFEPYTSFEKYKTWDWDPNSETDEQVAASQKQSVKDYDKHVREVVEGQMAEKGFTRVQTNPDILVSYMVGMVSANDTIDWDMDYQDQMRNAEVYESHGGIIVIDFDDARTGERLWRGTGRGSVNIDPTPQMVRDEVRNAVTRVLKQYPPE